MHRIILPIFISVFLFTYITAFVSDEAALAYCSKHKNTYIVTFWPNIEATNNVYAIERDMGRVAKIIAKKSFRLKNNGPFLFITKVYANEQQRTGNKRDNYRMARIKEKQSFTCNAPVRTYLIEVNDFEALVEFKYGLRDKYELDCLHIPDNHKESFNLAKVIFSPECPNGLNKAALL